MGDRTKQKLAAFPKLEEGWHFGEGVPFSKEALATAAWIENTADEVNNMGANVAPMETDIFPMTDGTIIFVFYIQNCSSKYLIEEDGKWEFLGSEKIKEDEN